MNCTQCWIELEHGRKFRQNFLFVFAQSLSDALVDVDAIQTGCGAYDGEEVIKKFEYAAEAEAILTLLQTGASFSDAISQALAERFEAAKISAIQRKMYGERITKDLASMLRLEQRMHFKPQLKSKNLDAETINVLLWQADLIHTYCNLNEGMENEYDEEARQIEALMSDGMDFRSALMQSFDECFWEGCLKEECRQANLTQLLQCIDALEKGEVMPDVNYQ